MRNDKPDAFTGIHTGRLKLCPLWKLRVFWCLLWPLAWHRPGVPLLTWLGKEKVACPASFFFFFLFSQPGCCCVTFLSSWPNGKGCWIWSKSFPSTVCQSGEIIHIGNPIPSAFSQVLSQPLAEAQHFLFCLRSSLNPFLAAGCSTSSGTCAFRRWLLGRQRAVRQHVSLTFMTKPGQKKTRAESECYLFVCIWVLYQQGENQFRENSMGL